ncbi:MAG: ABC transporter substrate-binding protein [Deltaproteobacteria bacterium]|nr:ABC transporter substrate-binding protein [Deltaproteobacteria bacterium]
MMSGTRGTGIFLWLAVAIIPLMTARVFSAETAGKLTPVRIGFASRSIQDMPFFVAHERGFFREEGLQAEIILMKAIQTVQSLLSGSIDFGTATGTAVSAAVNGADVRVVMALTDRPAFDLISQPGIRSVHQLRGKKIGVSAVGSLGEILARQILIANQVPLEQVTILPLGQSHFTYTTLKAGVIEAIMASIPTTFVAQDEGFYKLAAGGDVYRTVHGGLTTTRTTIVNRPDLVAKTIRATLRAVHLIRNDRTVGINFIKGPQLDMGSERDRLADRVYEAAAHAYLLSGSVDEDLQREMISIAARRIKPAQPVPPERVFDFSFARKINKTSR